MCDLEVLVVVRDLEFNKAYVYNSFKGEVFQKEIQEVLSPEQTEGD